MTVRNMVAMLGSSASVLSAEATRLLTVTRGCRPDMHEPDEQGVTARAMGRVFDNAGARTEMTLLLVRDVGGDESIDCEINMATLVALARIGAQVVLDADK